LHALEPRVVLRGKFNPEANDPGNGATSFAGPDSPTHDQSFAGEFNQFSVAEFQLLSCYLDARAMGISCLKAWRALSRSFELLDGFELPPRAWEPDVLALRVKDYHPQWPDQLCFTVALDGAAWHRSKIKTADRQCQLDRVLFLFFLRKKNSPSWYLWRACYPVENSPDTLLVLKYYWPAGALFF